MTLRGRLRRIDGVSATFATGLYDNLASADGFPIHERGVTPYPGLYFAGMPWMASQSSGFLIGIGKATRHIADHIVPAGAPAA